MQSFCQCAFHKINGQYHDDWKGNYILEFFYLRGKTRKCQFDKGSGNIYDVLDYLSWRWSRAVNVQIGFKFQQILTEANKSRILSRAAAYCFQYLSNDNSELGKGPHRFIHIRSTSRRIRQIRPWYWHMTFRRRLRTDRLLCMCRRRSPLTSFKMLANIARAADVEDEAECAVRSIFSVDWGKWLHDDYSFLPYHYMCHLEDFIEILPQAESYAPLIDMCKTKTLSHMSTFFPALSRRARRVIADYLERVESELLDAGDLEIK